MKLQVQPQCDPQPLLGVHDPCKQASDHHARAGVEAVISAVSLGAEDAVQSVRMAAASALAAVADAIKQASLLGSLQGTRLSDAAASLAQGRTLL